MPPIRVLLADDHSIVRTGIRTILNDLPDVEVVAEAQDGREALELIGQTGPDAVFMDIGMKNMNGLETTSRVTADFPGVRVLILSVHANEEYVWQALRAGAVGYLLKDSPPAEIEQALRAVMAGDTYLTTAVSGKIVADFITRSGNERSALELLTPRQREILQMLAEGRTSKEMARLLGISAKTVETHRAQLMERLDIHDVPGLVRFAIRVGLIQADD
jgi:DNA-binding NarL/FixJ family response regulator